MTKKILSVLAMMSIAAMMMLSSCTAAGVECGLIGKWEKVDDGVTITVEITADDKLIQINKYEGVEKEEILECTIKSVSNYEITYEYDGVELILEYSDLSFDTVKFSGVEFRKVN